MKANEDYNGENRFFSRQDDMKTVSVALAMLAAASVAIAPACYLTGEAQRCSHLAALRQAHQLRHSANSLRGTVHGYSLLATIAGSWRTIANDQ